MGAFAESYLNLFLGLIGLANLVCFIIVLWKMLVHEHTLLAIICFLFGCAGIGGLGAFIFGWINANEWGIGTVMLIWTVCLIALGAFYGGSVVMAK
jgi:hypothetical protein